MMGLSDELRRAKATENLTKFLGNLFSKSRRTLRPYGIQKLVKNMKEVKKVLAKRIDLLTLELFDLFFDL